MTNLSQLEGRRLRDGEGRLLGHVWDLRTAPRGDQEGADRAVAWLLVGRRGLLERLGFKREAPRRVACADVVDIDADEIVVRAGAVHERPGAQP